MGTQARQGSSRMMPPPSLAASRKRRRQEQRAALRPGRPRPAAWQRQSWRPRQQQAGWSLAASPRTRRQCGCRRPRAASWRGGAWRPRGARRCASWACCRRWVGRRGEGGEHCAYTALPALCPPYEDGSCLAEGQGAPCTKTKSQCCIQAEERGAELAQRLEAIRLDRKTKQARLLAAAGSLDWPPCLPQHKRRMRQAEAEPAARVGGGLSG